MKLYYKSRDRAAVVALTVMFVAPAFGTDVDSLIVTSDIHLSSSAGRWPQDSEKFADLLRRPVVHDASMLFIVGDMLDNVVRRGNGIISGGRTGRSSTRSSPA